MRARQPCILEERRKRLKAGEFCPLNRIPQENVRAFAYAVPIDCSALPPTLSFLILFTLWFNLRPYALFTRSCWFTQIILSVLFLSRSAQLISITQIAFFFLPLTVNLIFMTRRQLFLGLGNACPLLPIMASLGKYLLVDWKPLK